MTYLLSLAAALLGAGLGFVAVAAAAAGLAPLLGISSFEGAAGYFAIFLGGPVGAVVGLVGAPWLVLRRRGYRGLSALGGRLVLTVGSVVGLAALALAGFWYMRPIANSNGPPPQLVFEIRLPAGVALPDDRDGLVELQTSENTMPASSVEVRQEEGRPLIAGTVDMYYRTSNRILVLKMPDKRDVLFVLRLGRSPAHSKTFTAWTAADYIAEAGSGQPRKATAVDQYDIRYRAVWPGGD
jgi:hypothetical protein